MYVYMVERIKMENRLKEPELLRAFQNGDVKAFEELYRRLGDKLYFFALTLTGRAHTAEEVVQEAFSGFLRNAGNLSPDSSFSAYMFRSVRNRAVDHLRKTRSRREVSQVEADILFDASGEAATGEREEVSIALAGLPESQREVVVLKIYNDCTFNEIAEITGTSPNTAASRYRYALEKLREKLSEYEVK